MIQNISFIVIARNESFAIEKCLASITSMPLTECEVICVDSDSTDDTLEVMKRYATQCAMIQVHQCTGHLNSAVVRNAGLRHATKQYIFFVDGDVELNEKFIHIAMGYLRSGKGDAVTGELIEIYYDNNYQNELGRLEDRYHIRKEKEVYFTGGIFIVCSSIAHKVGDWDERLVRSQDIDYTLRLTRHGRFIAIPLLMGTHHTLSYDERPWLHFRKGYPMYFGMLIRKNLDRPTAVLRLLKQNRGVLAGFVVYALFLVGLLATALLSLPFLYVAFAISLMVISDLFWGAIRKKNIFNHFLTHYLCVPMIIAGIFFDLNRDWKKEIICLLLRMTGIPWLLRELYARRKVTIINYHDPSPDVFEKHMRLFSRYYSFIHIADLTAALKEKDFGDLPAKSLLVTLDDGHKGNARLFEIIKKYNIPAVLYVTAGVVNSNRHFWFKLSNLNKSQIDNLKKIADDERREWLKENFGHEDDLEYETRQALSLDELRKIVNLGGTIGSHTLFHPQLDKCSDEIGLKECSESRSCLEALVEKPVQHFAHPGGRKDERTKRWLIQAGYRTARTIQSGWTTVEVDPFELPTFGISDNAGINKAIVQASGLWDKIRNVIKSKT